MQNKLLDRLANLYLTDEEKYYKNLNLNLENEKKIKLLKDKYKNKRCFIIGSAPSLNLLNLEKMKNDYTFSVNRGYMLKGKGLKHTNFHVISDRYTFKDKESGYKNLNNFSDYLFCYAGMKKPPIELETVYFDYGLHQLNKEISFQTDLTKPLIAYDSVIHFAIQIAYYLGFNEIYILGVDLDFINNKGHAYKETDGEKQRQIEHSVKMAKSMLNGIEKCGAWLNQNGIKLYNASPKGIVDCIERVRYDELF